MLFLRKIPTFGKMNCNLAKMTTKESNLFRDIETDEKYDPG